MGTTHERNRAQLHLVTTADERTWPRDQPILFLGEWCRRFERRQIWGALEAQLAGPLGAENEERHRQYAYVRNLSQVLLVQLARRLDEEHEERHQLRYWRILLGHWLHRCVSVVFNRWFSLQRAIEQYPLCTTTALDISGYRLATHDSLSFIWATSDDAWNHTLYQRILGVLGGIELVRSNEAVGTYSMFSMQPGKPQSSASSPRQRAASAAVRMLQKFCRRNDAFLISTYLPKLDAALLQVALGQLPQAWKSIAAPQAAPDDACRRRLRLEAPGVAPFEHFLAEIVPELLPTCFLEGYRAVQARVEQLPWPQQPRFIYTCNNFDTDEVFKLWAADRSERGVRYYTGQHGMNYGSLDFCMTEEECIATSDAFLTWGWSDGSDKHVPAFMFKTTRRQVTALSPDGDLLLIELRPRHRIDPWDLDWEYAQFQEEQFRFAESLVAPIRAQLLVRLHPGHSKNQWSDRDRWNERSPGTRIDDGSRPIAQLISASRLVVHSYNSTGLAESLSQNLPTVCFWHRGLLGTLRTGARPYYDELCAAGIFFESPEETAQHIASVWHDIPGWWASARVQRARIRFCERYAHSVARPVATMKKLLLAQVVMGT